MMKSVSKKLPSCVPPQTRCSEHSPIKTETQGALPYNQKNVNVSHLPLPRAVDELSTQENRKGVTIGHRHDLIVVVLGLD